MFREPVNITSCCSGLTYDAVNALDAVNAVVAYDAVPNSEPVSEVAFKLPVIPYDPDN